MGKAKEKKSHVAIGRDLTRKDLGKNTESDDEKFMQV